MLLQFSVTNYRSFRDTTTLSLVPAPGVEHRPGQTAPTGVPHVPEALRAAVVYGPNGSGKSNLVKAINDLLEMIEVGEVKPAKPFRLDGTEQASSFELELVLNGRQLSYGLRITGLSVQEEWLAYIDGEEQDIIFHRQADTNWIESIAVSEDIAPAVIALARNIPSERLLLQVCGAAGLGVMRDIYSWARSEVWPDVRFERGWWGPLIRWEDLREHAQSLLREAGAGEVEIWFAFVRVPDEATRTKLDELEVSVGMEVPPEIAKKVTEISKTTSGIEVRLMRRHSSGDLIPFRMEEESDGTRRLLELSAWHYGITFLGPLGVVDELERSLHPLVVRMLLDGLMNKQGNGQLVCTTHDSNLLDRTLLPADSIWFMQKGPDGASRLYSLAEFQPDQLSKLSGSLEKGYLEGRFGAIPFLADPQRLGWGAK